MRILGHTGKALTNVVVIGIGGSYLSLEFVYESLRSSKLGKDSSKNRKLRFLANVDPIDFDRAVEGLDAETTLFVINSKTFTTAETILNAKTCRTWLANHYKATTPEDIKKVVNAHVCAVSTNIKGTSDFGINSDNVFGFWDW
jgi:glucose-6-phosphate isomerase